MLKTLDFLPERGGTKTGLERAAEIESIMEREIDGFDILAVVRFG